MYSLINWPGFSRKRYDSILGEFDRWLDVFENDLYCGCCGEAKENKDSGGGKELDDYNIKLPLPGFTTEDVKVSIEGNVLKVKAENKDEGKVTRLYSLNKDIDKDNIECSMKDGLLRIKIPRREKIENKYIKEIPISERS